MDQDRRQNTSGGGWREAFLNRPGRSRADRADRRDVDYDDAADMGLEAEREARRDRSLSRPRAQSRPRAAAAEATEGPIFNKDDVLEQDRALIEQLEQAKNRTRREGSNVRKPPPPPKVTPYRGRTGAPSDAGSPTGSSSGMVTGTLAAELEPSRPVEEPAQETAAHDTYTVDPTQAAEEAHNAEVKQLARSMLDSSFMCENYRAASREGAASRADSEKNNGKHTDASLTALQPSPAQVEAAHNQAEPQTFLEPVVPKSGELFTANDINSIMDQMQRGNGLLRVATPSTDAGQSSMTDNFQHKVSPPIGHEMPDPRDGMKDITNDFLQAHNPAGFKELAAMEEEKERERERQERESLAKTTPVTAVSDFHMPDRSVLRDQINSIDSWLEEDFSDRQKLNERGQKSRDLMKQDPLRSTEPIRPVGSTNNDNSPTNNGENSKTEIEMFQTLQRARSDKAHGKQISPVTLKNIAGSSKGLFPGMPLEKLVRALKLFASVRCDDLDLYLRILGEIPMQIRGVSPEQLTECARILCRLRLREETYVDLFSMEAMNMIRAQRRPQARAPRRPPAPKPKPAVEGSAEASAPSSTGGKQITPPTTPPPAAPAPFSPEQLVQLGNALSLLEAKHQPRFMEVFQEQLTLAIPRFSAEVCELVSPVFALSQLMPDPLRRAFLDRCTEVEAGLPLESIIGIHQTKAQVDIPTYQQEAAQRKRRAKYVRNIYVIEASVRKEQFSFFSSLPDKVKAYLDRIHEDALKLPKEPEGLLAQQVAEVLSQLGVSCELGRPVGPLGLHLVVKATNPRANSDEIVYECCDLDAYYMDQHAGKNGPPQLTAYYQFRQKLLKRMGIKLVHIDVWEWKNMSDAHRVNYMVKLQSL